MWFEFLTTIVQDRKRIMDRRKIQKKMHPNVSLNIALLQKWRQILQKLILPTLSLKILKFKYSCQEKNKKGSNKNLDPEQVWCNIIDIIHQQKISGDKNDCVKEQSSIGPVIRLCSCRTRPYTTSSRDHFCQSFDRGIVVPQVQRFKGDIYKTWIIPPSSYSS